MANTIRNHLQSVTSLSRLPNLSLARFLCVHVLYLFDAICLYSNYKSFFDSLFLSFSLSQLFFSISFLLLCVLASLALFTSINIHTHLHLYLLIILSVIGIFFLSYFRWTSLYFVLCEHENKPKQGWYQKHSNAFSVNIVILYILLFCHCNICVSFWLENILNFNHAIFYRRNFNSLSLNSI